MRYFLIIAFQIFFLSSVYPQSPTFKALVELNHNVDNNSFDLKSIELNTSENSVFINAFFKYYRNPNIQNANAGESMIFSIGYQYLIGVKITKEIKNDFLFPLTSSKDRKKRIMISIIDPHTGKESKIRGKYYDADMGDEVLKLSIDKNELPPGGMLNIFLEMESFNFKELNLTPDLGLDVTELTCSVNIPEIFNYNVQSQLNLEVIEESQKDMRLKHLTYSSPPIVDYNINSRSIQWRLKNTEDIKLILETINLPVDLGASVEQILKYSN